MKKFFYFCAVLTLLVFVLGCGESKKENVYDYPDEDLTDADTADDSEEPAKKQGELGGECYPNKTCNEGLVCDDNNICIKDPGNTEEPDDDADTASEKDDSDTDHSDTGITDNDSDTDSGDTQTDNDADTDSGDTQTDNDADTDSGDTQTDNDTDIDTGDTDNPEATENHNISGILQAGNEVSGIEAALYECGQDEKIAFGNTDANGKYSFNANISATKTYCVKAGDFASCFKGMSDHVANISEITNAVLLVDPTCTDLRESETKVRKYAKLGTGKWLGELDYSKLSGIKEGLRLLSSYLDTTNSKKLSEEIAADVKKTDGREFEKFFNGFKISANKKEVLINVTNPDSNEVTLNVEGGSKVVAEGFKIVWTVLNTTAEAATHKFRSVEPGEYVVRAKLVSGGDPIMQDEGGDPIMGGNGEDGGDPIMITEDSATILFLLEKATDVIDVRDMSKDIVKYIDNGIYAVIPKNTTIKKGNSPVNYLTYKLTKSNGTSQVSKISFEPAGTTFTGDSMYFVYELGTVFGGDPIMLSARRLNADGTSDVLQSAGGDPIMMEDGGDPIMYTAGGDPIMHVIRASGGSQIMYNAGGDPIMYTDGSDPVGAAAGGDPIMIPVNGETSRIAAGDPIMMGTSSSVMVAKTGHFSEFLINSNSLPVSVETIVNRWCDGSFYRGYSPVEFIKKGVTVNKPESTLLPYLTCERFGELGSDLYELMNKPVGFQRNLNLFENIFYVSAFYNRMKARRESGEVAAVTNGIELRSAIAALYTSTTSYNRSTTLADIFDSSMIPLTYRGIEIEDYSAAALAAISGNTESGNKFVASKNDMMIFANYVTTSAKGPNFSGVSSPLTADKFICAWFNPETPAQNCSKIYTLNDAGNVTADGTEVSLEEADAIFAHFFMPFNSRLSDEDKFNLFRTFFLTLKYAGIVFEGGTAIDALNEKLLKAAYLVFDGIDGNVNAVSIEDTFDASAHTVQVLKENVMETKPYITKVSALTDKISLNVAAASADVEKVLVRIEGYEFDKITDNTRTYYKPKGELKEKSIILTPGTLSSGLKPLKELLGMNDVDSLGSITGKVTVVATSKISDKTYTTQKTYEFLANSESDGVESKPVPANLQVLLRDSEGHIIPQEANPGIILNPGNRTLYPDTTGLINITELAPASYTINAFADGYYTKNVGVNVTAGATFGVEIRLDEELTGTADASLELSVNIATAKHPAKVYVQIYNEDMELVANETALFNDGTNAYESINIGINSGRYTLLAVGEEMYNYLESITIYEGNNSKEITVVAKNACGNGIIDSSEDCEPSVSGNLACSDIYPAAPNPGNQVVCNPATCVYDKSECGITFAECNNGIIDPGEGCDGGAKECSEIMGFEGSKGTAPCASEATQGIAPDKAPCSDWITAGNCSKVAGDCGTKPANTQWNDGTGKFEQTWNGTKWMPENKASEYGTTREECVYSCAKGYKWYNGACIDDPLSLGNICTGEESCFDNASEMTECPVYGSTLFGQDAQYADAGYCTKHSFSTTGSGSQQIVLDGFTHYEWHKVASNSAMTWDEAEEYCRTSTYGGKQLYWRLPNPTELLTIVDSDTTSPALSDSFIVYGYSFWAGEDEKIAGNAWMLDENGGLESVEKSASNHVICVHVNDYDPLQDRFTIDTETVKDAESGLMWQRYYTSAKTWSEALSYCENSNAGEKYDWRLPNRNELASLFDYTKSEGTMSGFPGIAAKEFWTSTSSTGEPAKAWTVDFESGTIAEGSKDDTKYLICVRKDEQCLGSDCVNPCTFDPCRNTVNSTGVCKPSESGDSYSCLCYSGFEWNSSLAKCVLPEFLPHGCEGLPEEHAQWNNVSTINQYHDGQGNWYPSYIAEYNEVPSSSECRFKCDTYFVYERASNKCVGATKPNSCIDTLNLESMHAEWSNPGGMFIQQWQLNETTSTWQWLPERDHLVYNEEADANECRYRCKENYTWDGNSTCNADTRQFRCTGLPEGTSWWNETIDQTWNGNIWVPSNAEHYSDSPVANACVFRCNNNGYFWKDSKCVTAFGRICTGQNKCRFGEYGECPALGDNYFGQDVQYAPAVCTPQSFTLNENDEGNTVTDNNTGLIWEESPSTYTYTWDDAPNHCNELNSSNYGGYNDWRLPTVKELLTTFKYIIPDYDDIDDDGIDDDDDTDEVVWTWASQEYKGDSEEAWAAGFTTPGLNHYLKTDTDTKVRCVRGDELPAISPDQFELSTIEGDEIVTDTSTGLVWQHTINASEDWSSALFSCEDLTYAGYSDWRLPNINELFSLVNYDAYPPVPDFMLDIPLLSEELFWSSSSSESEDKTLMVNFQTGELDFIGGGVPIRSTLWQHTYYSFLCVRSYICEEGKLWNGNECIDNPCNDNPCSDILNSTCFITGGSFSCDCDSGNGYFWNDSGTACVNPCDEDPCTPHSICWPYDWDRYSCNCEDGYFWSIYEEQCVNPCYLNQNQNKCTDMPNSTGTCFDAANATSLNDYECECNEGYYWNGSQCVLYECSSSNTGPCQDSSTHYVWSKMYDSVSSRESAKEVCTNLNSFNYGGFSSGWHLPTISELRTLIQNCSDTQMPGGSCGVRDDAVVCLSNSCYSSSCNSCDYNDSGEHSKFGDPAALWSSSRSANGTWTVSFYRGSLVDTYTSWGRNNVRCVRSACDTDSCSDIPNSICIPTSLENYSCGCKDGYFMNDSGTTCVNPCDANPCRGGEAECIPKSYDSYKCECHNADDGYFWDGSTCVNPCDATPCANVPYSTHECTPTDWNTHTCGCESGYFWDGNQCAPKTLGRICTGQNKCFNYNSNSTINCPAAEEDFFGQDAQYTDKCLAQSFTLQTLEGQKVVVDNNTGLFWEYSQSSDTYSWEDAPNHCADLNSSNYGGIDTWRVPNPLELLTIVDSSRISPATNSIFGASNKAVWTSKIYYSFNLATGWYYRNTTTTQTYNVLCVSGNETQQPATSADFTTLTISETDVVTDSKTGLMWQGEYVTGKQWQEALKYCEDSTYAGYTDWRLPNKNELASLVNYEKSGAPYSYFPDMPNKDFWSSSSYVRSNYANHAWIASFGNGNVEEVFKKNSNAVRCVRSVINPCDWCSLLDPNSTGGCSITSATEYTCGCEEEYFWDSSNKCVRQPKGICTGQDKCYAGFNASGEITCPEEGETIFGQDAQYAELGYCIPKNFEIRGSESETTVYDNNLELEWQQTISEDDYTWANAVSHCEDLEYAGYDDWRLPSPKELLSIVDNSRHTPAVDTDYFSGSDNLWTSKQYAGNTTQSWYVNFKYGYSQYASADTPYKVRCVRGTPLPDSIFVETTASNGDVIVTDTVTGLIWQKTYVTDMWHWALYYCENLTYAGKSDWRLPNKNELITLINYDRANPASDFPGSPQQYFWSSSTDVDNTVLPWYVFFTSGVVSTGVFSKTDGHISIRCVR